MVLPLIICVTSNVLIFSYVSSSSRRVQTGTVPDETQRRTISNRDLHLLRHMIIMFCVSVGGQLRLYSYHWYHRDIYISEPVHKCKSTGLDYFGCAADHD